MRKKPSIRAIEAFVRSQKAMPHMTFVSILIGVGVSAVTVLVMATLDNSLFGQEAYAGLRAQRNGRISRMDGTELDIDLVSI